MTPIRTWIAAGPGTAEIPHVHLFGGPDTAERPTSETVITEFVDYIDHNDWHRP